MKSAAIIVAVSMSMSTLFVLYVLEPMRVQSLSSNHQTRSHQSHVLQRPPANSFTRASHSPN